MPWIRVAGLNDLAEHAVIGVTHGTLRVALYRLHDGLFATSDTCPHQNARLSDGEVVGDFVECPAHYALFDIRTGHCEGGATDKPVTTYPVKVEDESVLILV